MPSLSVEHADRLMAAIDAVAGRVPSPEGCGCADRKANGVALAKRWVRKASGQEPLEAGDGDLATKMLAVEAWVGPLASSSVFDPAPAKEREDVGTV